MSSTPSVPAPPVSSVRIREHLLRELAVAASCDPRSVRRVLRGEQLRGLVHDRIVAALRARGIAIPSPCLGEVPR